MVSFGIENFEKRSILLKVKKSEEFNRRRAVSILTPALRDESDAEHEQKKRFCRGLNRKEWKHA
jgi:hypothetical protein